MKNSLVASRFGKFVTLVPEVFLEITWRKMSRKTSGTRVFNCVGEYCDRIGGFAQLVSARHAVREVPSSIPRCDRNSSFDFSRLSV